VDETRSSLNRSIDGLSISGLPCLLLIVDTLAQRQVSTLKFATFKQNCRRRRDLQLMADID
jgi:hypothetical protein